MVVVAVLVVNIYTEVHLRYFLYLFIARVYFAREYICQFLLKVDIREITPLNKNEKSDSTLKRFRSRLHVLIQIILLHGFYVCISVVRLNRCVINTL